jgi:hypothetical protein
MLTKILAALKQSSKLLPFTVLTLLITYSVIWGDLVWVMTSVLAALVYLSGLMLRKYVNLVLETEQPKEMETVDAEISRLLQTTG